MAHSVLPNLSGLKLDTEAEDNVGWAWFNPPSQSSDEEYINAMFGSEALMSVAKSIENGEVISSVRSRYHLADFSVAGEPMYQTLPAHLAYHTRRWWYNWQARAVDMDLDIGQGGYNTAYLVPASYVESDPGPLLFKNGFNTTVPAKGVIIRTNGYPIRKRDVIQEMITAAYAHANGFGPVIYAQFYYTTDQDIEADLKRNPPPPDNWDASLQPFKTFANDKADTKTEAGFTDRIRIGYDAMCDRSYTIAEAWEGDCHDKMTACDGVCDDGNPNFDPDEFARVFVKLVVEAANAGFWHMDMKRANLLYRYDERGDLELCFTDFDARFCTIMPPERRKNTKRCCIVATVACFLGEIRCAGSLAAWQIYVTALREELETSLRVGVDTIGSDRWCSFLRAVGEPLSGPNTDQRSDVKAGKVAVPKRGILKAGFRSKPAVQIKPRNKDLPSEEEKDVGERFRQNLTNYFYPMKGDQPYQSCFTRDEEGEPLFAQIVKWALTPPK